MTNTSSEPALSQRSASLDILRGFDLFLLVFFQPVFVALCNKLNLPLLNGIAYQFDHETWIGFRFWDLIMPLFLFMTGVSMPFSFEKYLASSRKNAIYWKIIRRFAVLFILGMVVQGNLLGLDPKRIYLYNNTLQAIATGYLIASMILLHCKVRMQIVLTLLLLIVYWVPMTFLGDFTPEGNFAEKVDRIVLGRFRDGVFWNEDGTWSFAPWYNYTWIWSSLTFGATVMTGVFAGQLMKHAADRPLKAAKRLAFIGMAMLAVAYAWHFQMPFIKRIWTSSMVLLSSGYCFLLMALFYYWIDVRHHSRGLEWLKIYGMNSIIAYVLGEVVNFRSIAASLSYGLEPYLGEYYSVWLSFANFLILFLILRLMYKHRVFVKV